jgi:hypothetical protein
LNDYERKWAASATETCRKWMGIPADADYDPIHNDAQAMELAEKLDIGVHYGKTVLGDWHASIDNKYADFGMSFSERNYAIVAVASEYWLGFED